MNTEEIKTELKTLRNMTVRGKTTHEDNTWLVMLRLLDLLEEIVPKLEKL